MRFERVYNIDIAWPACKEVLKGAFRYRFHTHTVSDYLPMLKSGEAQLWAAYDDGLYGAVVTCIDRGSAATALTVLSLAGRDLKKWAHLLDKELMEFARQNKCQAIEAVTRRGFSKLIPDFVEDGVNYIRKVD